MDIQEIDGSDTQEPTSTKKYTTVAFLASAITTLLLSFLFVACLIWIPEPTLLEYFGYDKPALLTDPDKIDDLRTEHMIGELVKNGTLISLKEYWEFQSSFYETIIGMLVAINGLVAAAVAFFIRGSSHERAETAAKEYLKGDAFKARLIDLVETKTSSALRQAQDDLDETIGNVSTYPEIIDELRSECDRLTSENSELRQHIHVIATRIASADSGDTEGQNLLIEQKDN